MKRKLFLDYLKSKGCNPYGYDMGRTLYKNDTLSKRKVCGIPDYEDFEGSFIHWACVTLLVETPSEFLDLGKMLDHITGEAEKRHGHSITISPDSLHDTMDGFGDFPNN